MTDYKEIIYDISTGETSERSLTKKEIDQIKIKEKESELYAALFAEQLQKKTEILERLGLTADEAKLLLG
jgi:hypothetical protein